MKIPEVIIPEEGLKIWICSNMNKSFRWGDLTCKPEECVCFRRGLCEYVEDGLFCWCIKYGLCDAQAYRIAKEE